MFAFLRRRRRKKWLLQFPLDEALWTAALDQHPIFEDLSADEKNRLRELTTLFLKEKQFDPVQGVALTEADRLSIAAQACLPIVNLGLDCYNSWSTLIIVPGEFRDQRLESDGHLVHEDNGPLSGEVLELGPVVLSLQDVKESGWGTGYNVVIHEMAHKLDALNGAVDGCPALPRTMDLQEWKTVFTEAFRDLTRRARRLGRRAEKELPIDPYAVTDPGEFFAVVTEVYFEQPQVLIREYPEVYRLVKRFYNYGNISEPT